MKLLLGAEIGTPFSAATTTSATTMGPSTTAQRDRDALNALYKMAGGAGWRINTNWGTDAALSSWFGVNVNHQGRVVKLALPSNNLRGILSPMLRTLPVHLR